MLGGLFALFLSVLWGILHGSSEGTVLVAMAALVLLIGVILRAWLLVSAGIGLAIATGLMAVIGARIGYVALGAACLICAFKWVHVRQMTADVDLED